MRSPEPSRADAFRAVEPKPRRLTKYRIGPQEPSFQVDGDHAWHDLAASRPGVLPQEMEKEGFPSALRTSSGQICSYKQMCQVLSNSDRGYLDF